MRKTESASRLRLIFPSAAVKILPWSTTISGISLNPRLRSSRRYPLDEIGYVNRRASVYRRVRVRIGAK